jgi:hypothetical protein
MYLMTMLSRFLKVGTNPCYHIHKERMFLFKLAKLANRTYVHLSQLRKLFAIQVLEYIGLRQ